MHLVLETVPPLDFHLSLSTEKKRNYRYRTVVLQIVVHPFFGNREQSKVAPLIWSISYVPDFVTNLSDSACFSMISNFRPSPCMFAVPPTVTLFVAAFVVC